MKTETNFYELPLYHEKDVASFQDQYNRAIQRIDQVLHQQQRQIDIINDILKGKN